MANDDWDKYGLQKIEGLKSKTSFKYCFSQVGGAKLKKNLAFTNNLFV